MQLTEGGHAALFDASLALKGQKRAGRGACVRVPGTGRTPPCDGFHSTCCTSTPVTLPSLPRKRSELMFHRRVHPSSWLDVVFSVRGQLGHGFCGSSGPAGGCGIISICVTLRHPCRWAVPMQSLPVSPPPITSTSLPRALTSSPRSISAPASTLFCCASMSRAKYMPFSSRPGMSRLRASGVPVAMT